MMGGMAAIWIAGFGIISRRFERQADTFAVQHMTRKYPDDQRGENIISDVAVHIVSEALRRVATLNNAPLDKKSWRHGSIAWRIEYLRTLVGQPIDRCKIDRQVRLICWSGTAILAALAAYELLFTM